jgi:very-short-patch-repair endonuclease
MTPDKDTAQQVIAIVNALRTLTASARGGWVNWQQVSKQIYGTDYFAIILSGTAAMPEYKHLFATTGNVVKLSLAGMTYQSTPTPSGASETRRIAQAVRAYASRLKDVYVKVEMVKPVAQVGGKFVEAVYIDLTEDVIASETPVTLMPQGAGFINGKIVGQEPDGGMLYIAFDRAVDNSHLPAKLKIDRGYLIHQLAAKLEALRSLPELIKPMLNTSRVAAVMIADEDSVKVADGLTTLATPWSRLLWGPPGAGKTYGLGHFVKQLLRSDKEGRILITAPSNRAVDVAVEQLVGQLERDGLDHLVGERKILRYGYPRKAQIIERPELLGPRNLDSRSREVKKVSAEIARVENEKQADDAALAVLRTKLLATQEAVKDAVTAHVRESRVVATTTTLAYVDSSPVSQFKWDTVVIDEVTMVYPAMCAYIGSLATKRLLLAGDPRQLGPVYESRGEGGTDFDWMGRDIFDRSGVSSGVGMHRLVSTDDKRMARITSQRRCVKGVWAGVKDLYPEVTYRADEDRHQKLTDLPPQPGRAMVLLDTSASAGHAVCKRANQSWQNPFTAELALEVALTMAAESDRKITVAIISPYRAQVRLLRKWLRQEQRAEHSPYQNLVIESGTVHQFQGSDADMVIFDLVDGPGRAKLGSLLSGDAGVRLVNVAVTRARGKFILLADRQWCLQHITRDDNALLLRLVSGESAVNAVPVAPPKRLQAQGDSRRAQAESPIERMLFDAVIEHSELAGVVPQHVICDAQGVPVTRADFAFPELKYAVYCDGKQWHLQEDRWQRDWRQRNKLTEMGWVFSVFTGSEINRAAPLCAEQIVNTYRSRHVLLRGKTGVKPSLNE